MMATKMRTISFDEIPCDKQKGDRKKLYKNIVRCIEKGTGLGVLQGRVIVLFEGKRKKKKRS